MSAPAVITVQALEAAAVQLSGSARGRHAASLLVEYLRGTGGSLDTFNQRAVNTLLAGFYGSFPGTAFDLLQAAAAGRVVPQLEDSEL